MYKILVFLMVWVSLQVYGGTTSVDAQAKKDVKYVSWCIKWETD